jgi:putative transposase
LKATAHPALEAFSGDAGNRRSAVEFVEMTLLLKLHISKQIKDVLAVIPIRWIVERTFAWLGNFNACRKIMKSSQSRLKIWFALR